MCILRVLLLMVTVVVGLEAGDAEDGRPAKRRRNEFWGRRQEMPVMAPPVPPARLREQRPVVRNRPPVGRPNRRQPAPQNQRPPNLFGDLDDLPVVREEIRQGPNGRPMRLIFLDPIAQHGDEDGERVGAGVGQFDNQQMDVD